jgi:hypothetical protein
MSLTVTPKQNSPYHASGLSPMGLTVASTSERKMDEAAFETASKRLDAALLRAKSPLDICRAEAFCIGGRACRSEEKGVFRPSLVMLSPR